MKNNMKKSMIFMLVVVVAGAMLFATSRNIKVSLNNEHVVFTDAKPFIDSANRTQVPFRAVLEKFGAKVSWDNDNRRAVAEKDGIKVEVPIGQPYILRNGVKVNNDTSALIKDSRTYLPIRIVMEAFGAKVGWDNEDSTVLISTTGVTEPVEEETEKPVVTPEDKELTGNDILDKILGNIEDTKKLDDNRYAIEVIGSAHGDVIGNDVIVDYVLQYSKSRAKEAAAPYYISSKTDDATIKELEKVLIQFFDEDTDKVINIVNEFKMTYKTQDIYLNNRYLSIEDFGADGISMVIGEEGYKYNQLGEEGSKVQ